MRRARERRARSIRCGTRCRCSCSPACACRRSTRRRNTSCATIRCCSSSGRVMRARCCVVTPFAWHRAGQASGARDKLRLQLVRSLMLVLATLGFFGGLALPAAGRSVGDHVPRADLRRRAVMAAAARARDARAADRVDRGLRRHPDPAAARLGRHAPGRGRCSSAPRSRTRFTSC